MYICRYMYIHICVYIQIDMYVYIYIYIYTCVYMYVCMPRPREEIESVPVLVRGGMAWKEDRRGNRMLYTTNYIK